MKLILVVFIGFNVLALALAGRIPRIFGGHNAEPHEFPFMVAIIVQNQRYCGGTIISELFILTAAHCLYDKNKEKLTELSIKAGKQNISAIEQTEQIRHSAKIIPHEEYVYGDFNAPDIGLIKLNKPLYLTGAVRPIDALAKKNTIFTGYGTIMGWGSTSYTKRWIEIYPDILQKAIVPILPNDVCAEAWKGLVNYTDKFLCTGPLDGTIVFCDGDSGGPLVVGESCRRTVIGIVNFGPKICGTKERLSVYAKISVYIDWINKNMK